MGRLPLEFLPPPTAQWGTGAHPCTLPLRLGAHLKSRSLVSNPNHGADILTAPTDRKF